MGGGPRNDGERIARPRLWRRYGQRRLLGGERHARFPAVQPSNRASHFEDLSGRTGGVAHEGDLIGGESQRLGFQDGLGRARRGNRDGHRGKNKP